MGSRVSGMQLHWTLLRAFLVAVLLLAPYSNAEEQIKWIPADNDNPSDVGPLPLSTRQREELLKLEQSILASPDPSSTLKQVAASNNMDPNDLAQILQKNRESMGSLAAAGKPSLLSAAFAKTASFARHRPRVTIAFLVVLTALYYFLLVDLPRTGILLSNRNRGLLTKGPTTLFRPPRTYLNQCLESSCFRGDIVNDSLLWEKFENELSDDEDDGLIVQTRTSDWKRAMTYQMTVSFDEIVGKQEKASTQSDIEDIVQLQVDDLFATPSSIVEWDPTMSMVAADDDDETHIVAAVAGMGDWGRYGLMHFTVSLVDDNTLILTTASRTHWEGLLVVFLDVVDNDSIRIRTSAIIQSGHVPRWSVVQGITKSLAKSIKARTRQHIARQKQSKRFAATSREKAKKRRLERGEKIRKMEEMAEDRRRRWQRNNPNSGSYRPSGDRMRSPNNAVY